MSGKHAPLRQLDYLDHMLEAVRLACSYTNGLEQVDFLADKRTQQAVILNLLTIGEAAAHIVREYPELPERYPALPWKQIRGMRNRMAHGYFDINLEVVWATIQQSLPELEREIISLQQALQNESAC